MNDASDFLHELVRDQQVGPAPLAHLLEDRRRRRRGRATFLAVSLAVVLLAAATAVVRTSTSTSPPGPATSTAPGRSDTWTRLPDLPLSPRHGVLGVWLGDEAVFIGGNDADYEPSPGADLRDGAAYDPATDTWRPLSPAPAPVGAELPAAVSDGHLLVQAARTQRWMSYDAAGDRWRTYAPAPLDGRDPVTAVRDGDLYVVSRYAQEGPGRVQVLDLASGTWSALPIDPFDPLLDDREVVATDHGVVVLGNNLETASGRYVEAGEVADVWDGATWRRFPEAEVAGSDWQWDGQTIVAAVRATDDPQNRNPQYPTGSLDPATATWQTHGFGPVDGLYTGFSSAIAAVASRTLAGGYVHDLDGGSWTKVRALPAGTVGGATAVLTPDGVLVLAADAAPPSSPTATSGPPVANTGPSEVQQTPQLWGLQVARVEAPGPVPSPPSATTTTTHGWNALPTAPLSARSDALGVWDGHDVLIVGGTTSTNSNPGFSYEDRVRDGEAYNPTTGAWRSIPAAPAPVEQSDPHALVGDLLVVAPQRGRWLVLDTTTSTWTTVAPPPLPVSQVMLSAFDGRLYVQSRYRVESTSPVQVLDPASGAWTALPQDDLTPVLDERTVVAVPQGVIVLGRQGADAWNGTSWRRLPDTRLTGDGWLWTGRRVIAGYRQADAGAYDPASGTWSRLPFGARVPYAWSSHASAGPLVLQDGYLYDDDTGSTTRIPPPPGPQRGGVTTVIAGDRLLVFGGASSGPGCANCRGGSPIVPISGAWSIPLG